METAKRRDMGIASLIIVISQLVSSFSSSHRFSQDMDKFKEEFQRSQIEREEFFVRKTDLGALTDKIDRLNDQIVGMSEQIRSLKMMVGESYSYDNSFSSAVVGCSAEEYPSWKILRL